MIITNEIVLNLANKLGFDLVGFAEMDMLEEETGKFQLWLNKGYQAGMNYLERNIEKRRDVNLVFPGVKSIISLGSNYYINEGFSEDEVKGKISRYAWGRDYHNILWEKLELLKNELQSIDSKFDCLYYVDTGPVMDKTWAKKAGLGWQGKNSNIINKNIGSWFFISTILTNYQFQASAQSADLCGKCTACIDACPTNAIVENYVVDSNKCISYQTIENKEEIDDRLKGKFENFIFGCDICQDVCPWNKKFAIETKTADFMPSVKNKEFLPEEISSMDEEEFKERFKESPIKRAKLKGLKRNASFVFEKSNL